MSFPRRSLSGTALRFLVAALTASTIACSSIPSACGALVLLLAPRVAMAAGDAAFDIDTADAATLAATLPGIGPVKANRIVEHRARHGPFGTLEALLAVKGIGPATLERIRAHLQDGAGSAERSAGTPTAPSFSTRELERATRDAVRRRVAAAERDAAPYR